MMLRGRLFGVVLAASWLAVSSCGGGAADLPLSPTPPAPSTTPGAPPAPADPEDEATPTPMPAPGPAPVPAPPAAGRAAVLIGAGDMGDCGLPGTALTARLLSGTIFPLGDHAYPHGSRASFRDCYDPHWGRFKATTRPTPGNHDDYEGGSGAGAAYFEYFGSAAGGGFYSYEAGSWHVISLNSEIMRRGVQEQAQLAWLTADLAAHDVACTMVYFHRPLFSSGAHAAERMRRIWNVLYPAGVDVVMNGHEHFYERFAPQHPGGTRDADFGIRQLIVGTGGARVQRAGARALNSELVIQEVWGVAKLILRPGTYDWEFIDVDRVVRDSGAGRCHGKPPRGR